jgi:hypothetical protein
MIKRNFKDAKSHQRSLRPLLSILSFGVVKMPIEYLDNSITIQESWLQRY